MAQDDGWRPGDALMYNPPMRKPQPSYSRDHVSWLLLGGVMFVAIILYALIVSTNG